MSINHKLITRVFIISGLMNMSVLIFSKLFTNPIIPKFDPIVMSNFGLLMIVVWGLAYIAIARKFENVKWLIGVFSIEKLIYGYIWINWMSNNNISDVYNEDLMAGIFYSIYGINDLIFFIFFSFIFFYLIKLKK